MEKKINKQINLWEDKDFLKEIGMRIDGYESGSIKTSTWKEVKQKAKVAKKV